MFTTQHETMKLLDWMQSHGTNVNQCSKAWEIHYATLHNIANGRCNASYHHGKQIEALTGGAVTIDEVCAQVAETVRKRGNAAAPPPPPPSAAAAAVAPAVALAAAPAPAPRRTRKTAAAPPPAPVTVAAAAPRRKAQAVA